MKVLKHIGIVGLLLLICLVIPTFHYVDVAALVGGTADAVSGASLEIPDQPSGRFYVLINKEHHAAAIAEWEDFFMEREVGVIMEDIDCLVVRGDAPGQELAGRYMARLAEHQMTLKEEQGILIASRADYGLFDVIIMSAEAAESYDFHTAMARGDVDVLTVEGGAA